MDQEKEKKAQSPIEALVIVSSVLAIAAYTLKNPVFFHIAGGICSLLVVAVMVFIWVTTPKGLKLLNLGFIIFGGLFLAIGWMWAKSFWDGLLLGLSMMGIATVIVYSLMNAFRKRIHREYQEMHASGDSEGGFMPDGYDYMSDLDNLDEWETILCDEKATPAERVRAMELAFDRACGVNGTLIEGLDAFEKNVGTMNELAKYMESGLWKKDFEADEAGEFSEEIKRGVLSEDGLYNVLSEYDDLRKRLRKLGSK